MKNNNFMSRIVLSCLAVSLLFISCASSGDDDDDKKVIVCFGDSLTAGMSATDVGVDDPTHSYPAYLQAMLDGVGDYEVINAGVSGNTTTNALDRLQSDVIANDPDVVIICLGANDYLHASTGTEWDTAQINLNNNLGEIIEQLDNGKRRIYVANFLNSEVAEDPIFNVPFSRSVLLQVTTDIFNVLVPSSSKTRVLIPDIWEGIWGVSGMMNDPDLDKIHPVAAGYQRMAETIFDALAANE